VTDRNVESVRAKLLARSQLGISKYGCTTETLGRLEGLIHAQEEAMDLCIYLEQEIALEVALVAAECVEYEVTPEGRKALEGK